MSTLNVGIIGTGGITLQNHLPGLALCRDVKVRALCDSNPVTLEAARQQTGAPVTSANWEDIVTRDDVHAIIIATPNFLHPPIAIAAARAGKHVLCEKPLALNADDAAQMAVEADKAGVRHMTAFTYQFVPAMRYLRHLVDRGDLGTPYHFRSCRLQDWGTRNLGWRQVKKLAGTGEIGDMLSHRIDFALHLIGPMKRLVANLMNLTPVRGGAPNDTDDWVAILAEFCNGASGVLESSKLASGRNESWRSLDYVEINGSEATFEFTTGKWNELQHGKLGGPGLAAHRADDPLLRRSLRAALGRAAHRGRAARGRHGAHPLRWPRQALDLRAAESAQHTRDPALDRSAGGARASRRGARTVPHACP